MGILLFILSIFLIIPWTGYAQLEFYEGWESGRSRWNENGGCFPYSFQLVPDPCGGNNTVLKITTIIGDTTEACTNNWKELAGTPCVDPPCYAYRHRAELIPQSGAVRRPNHGEDHWAGWRVFFPADFPAAGSGLLRYILAQMIPPPFDGVDWALEVGADNILRHNLRRTLAGQQRNDLNTNLGELPRGEWINFVSHYRRSTTSNGRAQFWVNGQQVLNYTGITSQSTTDGGLFKHGIYRGQQVSQSLAGMTFINYFDDMRIAYGANQYDTVAPTVAPGACGGIVEPPPPADVIFTEDFESTNWMDRWTQADWGADGTMQRVTNNPKTHRGTASLRTTLTMTNGQTQDRTIRHFFDDQTNHHLYMRWYQMIEQGPFFTPTNRLALEGNALVGWKTSISAWPQDLDPNNPKFTHRASHRSFPGIYMHSYWGGIGNVGVEGYTNQGFMVTPDVWQCIEIELKGNDIGMNNGALNLWVDGVLRSSLENLFLRGESDMKIRAIEDNVRLTRYLDSGAANANVTFWKDDIVVSKSRIGCEYEPPTPPPPPPPALPTLFNGGPETGIAYYVSPTGTGAACSIGTPCSLNEGMNRAQPGQSVILTDGTYPQAINTVRGGLASQHITIRAQNTLGATVNGSAKDLLHLLHSYITVRGIHFFDTKAGIPLQPTPTLVRVGSGVGHIILESNHFEHCGNVCFHVPGTNLLNGNFILRNNTFDGAGYMNGSAGKHIGVASPVVGEPGSQNLIVYGNEFLDFTGDAFDLRVTTNGAWIFDNVIHGQVTAASHGVTPEPTRAGMITIRGSGIRFYRNIIRDSATGTELLRVRNSASTEINYIYNNILHDITGNTTAILCETGNTGAATQIYNNTLFNLGSHTQSTTGCTPTTVNNLGVNGVANNLATTSFDSTYFVNSAGDNFALTSLATNAIDAVTVIPFSFTDFVGRSVIGEIRDYGAHEFNAVVAPPPPPSGAFPTTVVLDDFNRPNENPIVGVFPNLWVNGAIGAGALRVESNMMRHGNSGSNSGYIDRQFGANQEVFTTFPNATNHALNVNSQLLGCLISPGGANASGYAVEFRKKTAETDKINIYRIDNSSYTQLGSPGNLELDNGDKLGMQILSDGTINIWADTGTGWTQHFTQTDPSPHNCQNTYIGAKTENLAHYYDDFGGGNITTSGSGSLLVAPEIIFFN